MMNIEIKKSLKDPLIPQCEEIIDLENNNAQRTFTCGICYCDYEKEDEVKKHLLETFIQKTYYQILIVYKNR